MTKVALGLLRSMSEGAVLMAARTFPHPFTFTVRYTDGSSNTTPPTDALVDILVRTRCIATETPIADVRIYRITQRGERAVKGEGFDPVDEQIPLLDPTP